MLEDLGFARVVPEEGGKKIYEITDEGRKHLAEHSTTVDDIFERIAQFVEGFTDTPMTELNQAFQRLGSGHLQDSNGAHWRQGDARDDPRHHPTGGRRDRGSHEVDVGDARRRPSSRVDWSLQTTAALDSSDGSRISSATHFCVVQRVVYV